LDFINGDYILEMIYSDNCVISSGLYSKEYRCEEEFLSTIKNYKARNEKSKIVGKLYNWDGLIKIMVS
jgi:hypothetical protein